MKKFIKFFFLSAISVLPGILIFSFSVKAGEKIGEMIHLPPSARLFLSDMKIHREQAAAAAEILPVMRQEVYADTKTLPENTPPADDKEISLLFVGDIMLDRGVAKSISRTGGDNHYFIFENAGFLKEADLTFGNLEGPVSGKGKDLRNLYSFRMATEAAPVLKEAGFDFLSVANNHTGDWGREAFEDTLANLAKESIFVVGGGMNKDEAAEPKITEINGLKIGFVGFSDVGPNWLKADSDQSGIILADTNLPEIVKKAASSVDVLVVSFHFGEEYQDVHNKRQENLAREAIDNGAKIIVGHHSHVVQDTEQYNGGFIAYSLGNFIFDQNFSEETMRGAVLKVKLSPTGEIKSTEMQNIKINEFFQPQLMKE